jgi:hypothetical protein
MLESFLFTADQLAQLKEDDNFRPLLALFKKFGQRYLDGSIKVNLRKPVMPDPKKTKWDLLPFNEGDTLIDIIWDLFLKNGASYKTGVEVFDILRNYVPCIQLTSEEKKFILNSMSAYRSDYDGTSLFPDNGLDLLGSIQRKIGQP